MVHRGRDATTTVVVDWYAVFTYNNERSMTRCFVEAHRFDGINSYDR